MENIKERKLEFAKQKRKQETCWKSYVKYMYENLIEKVE